MVGGLNFCVRTGCGTPAYHSCCRLWPSASIAGGTKERAAIRPGSPTARDKHIGAGAATKQLDAACSTCTLACAARQAVRGVQTHGLPPVRVVVDTVRCGGGPAAWIGACTPCPGASVLNRVRVATPMAFLRRLWVD